LPLGSNSHSYVKRGKKIPDALKFQRKDGKITYV